MSTYYRFRCEKCKVDGGFFSRQFWGWGNFDLIDAAKFVMLHVGKCGCDKIRVVSEHDESFYPNSSVDAKHRIPFLDESRDIFPRSGDWKFMRENIDDFNERWIEQDWTTDYSNKKGES